MSGKDKNHGNILVNPAEYVSQLEGLETDRDAATTSRLEDHIDHHLRLGGAITYIDENGNHVIEDRHGTRSFNIGDAFPSTPQNAELEIRELAFRHGVHSDRSDLDVWRKGQEQVLVWLQGTHPRRYAIGVSEQGGGQPGKC